MPWKNNENGDPKYEPDIYRHGELPTWRELYTFYKDMILEYDPYEISFNDTTDPYLGIPTKLVLLAQCCNQLNKVVNDTIGYHKFDKMLLDHMRKYKFTQDIMDSYDITFDDDIMRRYNNILVVVGSMKFYLSANENSRWIGRLGLKIPSMILPYIYIFDKNMDQFQDRRDVEFITADLFKDVFTRISVIINLKSFSSESTICTFQCVLGDKKQSDEWKFIYGIIGDLLSPVIKYFEGEGIGWKDASGNLITSNDKPPTMCNGAGSDPAL